MNVLFIVPPYRTTDALVAKLYPMPLAAVLLATVLKRAGHDVTVKDFLIPAAKKAAKPPVSFRGKHAPAYVHYGAPLSFCKQWIHDCNKMYDVICLMLGQCNIYETGEEFARYIKEETKLPLVIGGPFATTATAEALRRTGADVVVLHEGEPVIEEAVQRARRGGEPLVLEGGHVSDIDSLPLPDWTLAPPEAYPKYQGRVRGVLTVSRGCPHRCSFCSVHTIHSRCHRRMGQGRIEAELENLVAHGVTQACFLDDNLFINRRETGHVLGAIENVKARHEKWGHRVHFYVEEGIEVRVAAVPGLLSRIVAAGFRDVALGVETLSEDRLRENKKPHKGKHLEEAVSECRKAGIVAKAFYIIGLPGDTVNSVCRDMVAFARTGLAVRANNLKLYPGTDTTAEFLRAGRIPADYDWRLSSFYTPDAPGLTYAQIRRLKTCLGALGIAADSFGVNLFADTFPDIRARLVARGYNLKVVTGKVEIEGKMWRPTPYLHMAEILLLRQGVAGAVLRVTADGVEARELPAPADEVQGCLGEVINGKAVGRLF